MTRPHGELHSVQCSLSMEVLCIHIQEYMGKWTVLFLIIDCQTQIHPCLDEGKVNPKPAELGFRNAFMLQSAALRSALLIVTSNRMDETM